AALRRAQAREGMLPELNIEDLNLDVTRIIETGLTIVAIIVAAYILKAVAGRIVKRAVRARMPGSKTREELGLGEELAVRADTIEQFAGTATSVLIWILAAITIVAELGVDITAIIATLGVASLALGFAAQNIIRDFMHGFFIIMEDWYRSGEVATVAGISGLVVEVNLRRTMLRDLDGTLHNIPNSKIELASNLTRDWSRVNLDIRVAYGQDLHRIIQVINDECAKLKADETFGPNLITTPEVLRVNDLGSSGVEIKILGDTKPIQQWALMGQLRLRLTERFKQEGVQIGWPITSVHLEGDRSAELASGGSGQPGS
ncbi:MAG: mechanosensitive ion channel family protein, partial [Myxococcota bacterium]